MTCAHRRTLSDARSATRATTQRDAQRRNQAEQREPRGARRTRRDDRARRRVRLLGAHRRRGRRLWGRRGSRGRRRRRHGRIRCDARLAPHLGPHRRAGRLATLLHLRRRESRCARARILEARATLLAARTARLLLRHGARLHESRRRRDIRLRRACEGERRRDEQSKHGVESSRHARIIGARPAATQARSTRCPFPTRPRRVNPHALLVHAPRDAPALSKPRGRSCPRHRARPRAHHSPSEGRRAPSARGAS